MPRLGAALASNGEVGQVLLQGPANHLVHDLGEVPVTGSGVQPERPMHGGIEVDGGTTSGGHTQRVAVNVKASKRYFKFLVKGLQSVSCLIGFGVASGGLAFNDFGGANRIYLARHTVGKWSCCFESKPVLPYPRMETIVQAALEQ